ncbi:hypothetical protein DFR50_10564 [Roseiarcus fermentans]|uniref:Uncharacterized protein n=1 Tax=Roseiarcus fermentans TaxID=1473586 RepID=A0A366FP09_9HYPH|nr:hypothetical protein [Roseiarcus fermentans]RBP16423.1 hypothetical protein DFR50_10564 [Roseiarcus fermentans]
MAATVAALAARLAAPAGDYDADDAALRESIGRLGREVVRLFSAVAASGGAGLPADREPSAIDTARIRTPGA